MTVNNDRKQENSVDIKNILVGYHGHCNDGMGAAWSANFFGVPQEHLFELNYGEPLPVEFEETLGDIVFLDFRPALDDLKRLSKQGRQVIVVDHHKKAYEEACERLQALFIVNTVAPGAGGITGDLVEPLAPIVYYFDNGHSGARLAWDFFRARAEHKSLLRPRIIDLIEDYDLWTKKLPLVEEMNCFLVSAPLTLSRIDDAMKILEDGPDAAKATLQHYVRMRDGLVQKAVQNFGFTDLGGAVPGARWPMVCSSVFKNEIADVLLGRGYEVAVVWSHAPVDGVGKCLHSLRSRGFDVAEVAKKFGGNGHQRAAGFAVSTPFELLK